MPAKKKESEKKFQARVVKYLKSRGAYVVVHTATGYGRAGIPDILMCFKGAFFGIEVKAESGKLTAHQTRELDDIQGAGGWAIDLYPSKFEDLGGLMDIIESLAMRNQTQAKKNYLQSLEDMEDNGTLEEVAASAAHIPEEEEVGVAEAPSVVKEEPDV